MLDEDKSLRAYEHSYKFRMPAAAKPGSSDISSFPAYSQKREDLFTWFKMHDKMYNLIVFYFYRVTLSLTAVPADARFPLTEPDYAEYLIDDCHASDILGLYTTEEAE